MEGKIDNIIAWFERERPAANSELDFENPFQLLVSVILSAQCTDKRVNMVTPALFAKYPTPHSLAGASFEEVYELIKSISYPNNKARHLIGMAAMLENDFAGIVPDTVEELQKLPGVGRKTANVVASIVYNRAVIAVDTHVFRVARRLGLSKGRTPLAVEKDLTAQIGEELRPIAHHWLILHGRYVCVARKPKCDECGLRSYCDYYEQKNNNHA
ncbi:MAG: endonuclease III [Bacteroidales bacterium]|nr:endonuclease III [Bacteroidales bacterium]